MKNDKGSVTVILRVRVPPSFKNSKRAIKDRNSGKMRTLTPAKIKARMDELENAILSALYSGSQIIEGETHSECWKRLRTVLSGLSDDSIQEIPCGSWAVEFTSKENEGVTIELTLLDC